MSGTTGAGQISGQGVSTGSAFAAGDNLVRGRSRRRPRVAAGPPCPHPSCGAPLGKSLLSGRDTKGRPLRNRRCDNCGRRVVTVEMVVPAKFSEVDDYHFRIAARAKRERYGWTEQGARKTPRSIGGGAIVSRRTRLPEWEQEEED